MKKEIEKYRIGPNILWYVDRNNEIVVFKRGLMKRFILSGVSSVLIWWMIFERKTTEEICEELSKTFNESFSKICEYTIKFLKALENKGLIERDACSPG